MYRKGAQGWLKHIDFIILDMICLQISFVLAYMLRHGMNNPYLNKFYCGIAIVMILIDAIVSACFSSFKNVLKRGYYREFVMTVKHAALVVLITSFYLFATQQGEIFSRMTYGYMAVFYVVIGYPARICWKYYLRKKKTFGSSRSLLIVTTERFAQEAIDNVCSSHYSTFHIPGIAVIDKNMQGKKVNGVQVVAGLATAAEYVCREWVDEILIVLPPETMCPQELMDSFYAMGVVIHIAVAKMEDNGDKKQVVERLGRYTVVTSSVNCATPLQLLIKRGIDIAAGVLGCICTGILFLIFAPAIYIQSPGTIFFSQIRVGKNGRKFKMYKFRSMYMDAEERKKELMEQNRVKDGFMFKMDYDPRIIGCRKRADGTIKKGIGNFMRDTSLDEFPQFFNILKGDMSLVGTRPPTVDEWEKYELHHRARLAIKPGLTGMWQVNGRSNITDFEEVVKLDTKYIVEWSIGLDIRILLKTVRVVLGKEGSM